MTRTLLLLGLATWLGVGLGGVRCFADGAEVVVIYNSRQPDSESLARYYARLRNVPREQIFGFKLSTDETMSRAEFRDELARPLAKKLEKLKLWRVGSGEIPGTNGQPAKAVRKVVASKIRYAVLCYGVPLKIQRAPDLHEDGEERLRPELRRNEAAVDSELACLPLIYSDYLLTGPLNNPLFGTTNAAWLNPTNGLLMVARLDAPAPSLARGLVDKALQAETDGLWGRAYFDLRNTKDPGYKAGDEWLRQAAQITQQLGFETVVDESADAWPASFPMSQIAIYMGWYRENAAGPFALPEVEFMPGAFAYHLHSFSAATIHSTNQNWVGPLLAKGATCTMGCVNEPYLGGTPEVGVFAGRWLYFGFTFGEAAYACQPLLSWQTTVVGDPLYRPFGKNLIAQHEALLKEKSKLAEWSTLRILNLSRLHGMRALPAATLLEETPLTKESAVLTEKLADLYTEQGKPSSAISAYERALTLHPSPQQRLRLRLTLGEKLIAAQRDDEARANYQKLLQESPAYPGATAIEQKIVGLTPATTR